MKEQFDSISYNGDLQVRKIFLYELCTLIAFYRIKQAC